MSVPAPPVGYKNAQKKTKMVQLLWVTGQTGCCSFNCLVFVLLNHYKYLWYHYCWVESESQTSHAWANSCWGNSQSWHIRSPAPADWRMSWIAQMKTPQHMNSELRQKWTTCQHMKRKKRSRLGHAMQNHAIMLFNRNLPEMFNANIFARSAGVLPMPELASQRPLQPSMDRKLPSSHCSPGCAWAQTWDTLQRSSDLPGYHQLINLPNMCTYDTCELVVRDGYQCYQYTLLFPTFQRFGRSATAYGVGFLCWTCSKGSWAKSVGTMLCLWPTLHRSSKLESLHMGN